MIVKNEEKWLEKCLTALKPLLDAVSSELVIVDTGSTDRTVEIAEKFTDKVHHFEWINDFAAARNFGMEKCVGEWFMFIDADEIFDEDIDEIIHFFSPAGESKRDKYNSACLSFRNYTSEDGARFEVASFFRIIKKIPGHLCHFVGAIHESFANMSRPVYNFTFPVHHYGYVLVDDEIKERKSKRNLDLLYKEYEQKPHDIRTVTQLAESIFVRDGFESEEMERYFLEGIEIARKNADEFNNPDKIGNCTYYTKAFFLAINHYLNSNPKMSLEYVNEYIGLVRGEVIHLIDAYYFKAAALENMGKSHRAETLEAVDTFFEYYKKYENGTLDRTPLMFCGVQSVVASRRLNIAGSSIKIFQATERYNEAYEVLEKYCNIADQKAVSEFDLELYKMMIQSLGDTAKKQTDFERLVKYYKTTRSTEDRAKIEFYEAMLEALYIAEPADKRIDFAKKAAAFSGEFDKASFFGRMSVLGSDNDDEIQSYVDETLVQQVNPSGALSGYGAIYYEAVKRELDLRNLLDKLNFESLQAALQGIAPNARDGSEFAEIVTAYISPEDFTGSIRQLFWAVSALEQAVVVSENLDDDKKAALFMNFAHMVSLYVTNVYSPDLLNDADIGVLLPIHRFGYCMAVGQNALEAGDASAYLAALKAAVRTYPDMKDVVKFLTEQVLEGEK
jgi:glycosyltransferase involved in cell wall biosynthesis